MKSFMPTVESMETRTCAELEYYVASRLFSTKNKRDWTAADSLSFYEWNVFLSTLKDVEHLIGGLNYVDPIVPQLHSSAIYTLPNGTTNSFTGEGTLIKRVEAAPRIRDVMNTGPSFYAIAFNDERTILNCISDNLHTFTVPGTAGVVESEATNLNSTPAMVTVSSAVGCVAIPSLAL